MNQRQRSSGRPSRERRSARGSWRIPVVAALVLAAAGAGLWLLGKDRRGQPERAQRQEYVPVTGPLHFPGSVLLASGDLRELYEFAARRPDVLHYLPCFCGCWRAGHESNDDCFIDEIRSDGVVDIDGMGFTWTICQDVARVAMQMTERGRPLTEIQELIDRKYAGLQDERTPTPLPPLPEAGSGGSAGR